jgi:hypothetical protein
MNLKRLTGAESRARLRTPFQKQPERHLVTLTRIQLGLQPRHGKWLTDCRAKCPGNSHCIQQRDIPSHLHRHIGQACLCVTCLSQEGQAWHRDAKAGAGPGTQTLQRACKPATQELIKS